MSYFVTVFVAVRCHQYVLSRVVTVGAIFIVSVAIGVRRTSLELVVALTVVA